MAKILNKCPICGSKLQYHSLMQYTEDYKIKSDGRLSKRFKISDCCPMGCGFIACISCDFYTNCDLEVEENYKLKIFEKNGVYMYEEYD